MTRAVSENQPVLAYSKVADDRAGGVRMAAVVSIACAFAAVWIAAGSSGLLGHSLRHVLTWVFGGAAVVAGWPGDHRGWRWPVSLLAGVVLCVVLTDSILGPANITAVLILFALVAHFAHPNDARPMRAAMLAMGIFVVFRLAAGAIPWVWMLSDRLGQAIGFLAGFVTGQKLSVGPTFGGIDFLVLSGAFYLIWILQSPSPRFGRAVYGGVGILAAHFVYLAMLSYAPAFLKDIPVGTKDMPNPIWSVPLPLLQGAINLDAVAVHQFVPNNLPIFAGLFHLLAIGAIVRWGNWQTEEVHRRNAESAEKNPKTAIRREIPPSRSALGFFALAGAAIIALVLPAVVTYCSPAPSLEGKKIVFSSKLYGNFLKPENGDYGHLSIGMYGDLVPFIESLGGTAKISSTLSNDELNDADALVLIYPNKPFVDEAVERGLRMADRFLGFSVADMVQQAEIERIWRYVENGGTLLVMGEHTIYDEQLGVKTRSYLNQILAPSAIRVNFDSAMFEVGGWLQSYQPISHPITAGTEDSRNQFGVVIGASLDVKFPAKPVLIGRWGWADPGDEGNGAAMMGNHKYDPGERLGDMVLVAEQAYGKGRVMAFGDPSNVTNGITIGAHPFNARLYSYLTHNPAKDGYGNTPQTAWRQILGMILAGVLLVLICKNAQPIAIAGLMLAMSASLWFWSAQVAARAEIVPDANKFKSSEVYQEKGKMQKAYTGIAYIDNAHLGFYSEESWRTDGTMGLAMNLKRNGYLTFMAPDLSARRLGPDPVTKQIRASLVVMPAPTKSLTSDEIATLKNWVNAGGTLVMTVGWDRYLNNRELLAAFKFYEEKIPLDALELVESEGSKVVDIFRQAHREYKILAGGVEQHNGFGYFVFDVEKGNEKFEVLVNPRDGSIATETSKTAAGDGTNAAGAVAEKPTLLVKKHTAESYQQALIKRGDLPPSPMGFFKVPYVEFGTYRVYVRFHSAWPIRCADPLSSTAAVHGSDLPLPLITWRSEGAGKVVLIGDTEFATNQNLENEGGQPFEGMRENADFWRWFISYYIKDGMKRGDWYRPPDPNPKPAGAEKKKDDGFDLEGKKP